jgi:hypothetical protein
MAKRVRRNRQKANALPNIPSKESVPAQDALVVPENRNTGGLLDRILSSPDAALVIPRLQPEVLHRVIQTCGLEDCGDLVALATPQQLRRVFDLDLWRASQPGVDEQLDADRFGTWLDVLMESGATIAAQKVAAMDVDLVVAALAQHLRVFDAAAVAAFESADGEMTESPRGHASDFKIGGYLIEATRTSAWDSIVSLLLALELDHPDYFHRVMRGCLKLSNAGFELDGLDDLLDDRKQDLFDLAVDREQRREQQGYVTPAQARAFLQTARQLQLGAAAPPSANPIAQASFRAIEPTPPAEAAVNDNAGLLPEASAPGQEPPDVSDQVASIVDILRDAGVLTPQPRALLGGPPGEPPQLARIEAYLQVALDSNPNAYSRTTEELAFLANALVAGCSIQARPFTEREASDAVLAICNLGLENWPQHWRKDRSRSDSSDAEARDSLAEDFSVDHDLVSVFQVGWTILYNEVCMDASKRLISVVAEMRCSDRDTQSGLNALRIDMTRHWRAGTPWGARDALDVLAILDLPAWAAMLGLIDELPVLHAAINASGSGVRSVSATGFTFISDNSQIASIRDFLRSLPDTLSR